MSDELARVYGHPRSGNHFLAAMIHQCLYSEAPELALKVDLAATGHWSHRQAQTPPTQTAYTYEGITRTAQDQLGPVLVPYGKLLGHHRMDAPADTSRSIYIYRDGRDVALSVYAWLRFRSTAQQKLSLEQYLAQPIDWVGSPGYRARPTETLFEHWKRHIEEWLKAGALPVRYEDLVRNPLPELSRIAEHLGMPAPRAAERLGAVGWNAGHHGAEARPSARWRAQLSSPLRSTSAVRSAPTSSALVLYDAIVPRSFVGRWR